MDMQVVTLSLILLFLYKYFLEDMLRYFLVTGKRLFRRRRNDRIPSKQIKRAV